MQRLLTVLVLVLLIAVAALGIAVYKIGDQGTTTARQPVSARPTPPPELDSEALALAVRAAADADGASRQASVDGMRSELGAATERSLAALRDRIR